jgi:proliferating cell nuclear antigen
MLEAKIKQGTTLKKILEAVKELVTDTNFECSKEGIVLQAMDSAHVSLINLSIKSEGFDEYECDKNKTLGINMTTLAKILKCCGSDDSITIKSSDESSDSVQFVFESKDEDRISKFDLKLIELDGDQLGIPDATYSAVISMSSSRFKKIISDLQSMGDTCNISCNKKGVTFSVNGEDISGSIKVLPGSKAEDKKDDEETTISLTDPISLTFALKYLGIFSKSSTLSNKVTISLASDNPVMIEYQLEIGGYIRYYLAPKIDEDEDNKE